MIFVFDWGHETLREIGPLSKSDFNTTLEPYMAWLVVRRRWFRAFFIPTIPTETAYGLIDENQNFFRIDRQTFDHYKPLALLNGEISRGVITDEEYDRRRNELGF